MIWKILVLFLCGLCLMLAELTMRWYRRVKIMRELFQVSEWMAAYQYTRFGLLNHYINREYRVGYLQLQQAVEDSRLGVASLIFEKPLVPLSAVPDSLRRMAEVYNVHALAGSARRFTLPKFGDTGVQLRIRQLEQALMNMSEVIETMIPEFTDATPTSDWLLAEVRRRQTTAIEQAFPPAPSPEDILPSIP